MAIKIIDLQSTLEAELGLALHPSGSEYFGYFNSAADFDFFVSQLDEPDVVSKLECAGFRAFAQSDYDQNHDEWELYRRDYVDIFVIKSVDAATVEDIQLTLIEVIGVDEFAKFCKRDRMRLYYIALKKNWHRRLE